METTLFCVVPSSQLTDHLVNSYSSSTTTPAEVEGPSLNHDWENFTASEVPLELQSFIPVTVFATTTNVLFFFQVGGHFKNIQVL